MKNGPDGSIGELLASCLFPRGFSNVHFRKLGRRIMLGSGRCLLPLIGVVLLTVPAGRTLAVEPFTLIDDTIT